MAEGCDRMLNPRNMSPAPLRLPSNKTSNKPQPVPRHSPIKVYSEYLFPLPPTGMPYSDSQASRPRSPFPPPYSSLIPATSTSSSKEPVPCNNHNKFIKRSVHAVRGTQSSSHTQQVSQCKPLPNTPLVDIKGEHGENKTWKQTVFRLTPAPIGLSKGDIDKPRPTNPSVNAACRQELSPQTTTSPEESLISNKEGKKQEEMNTTVKPQEVANTSRNKSNISKDSSGYNDSCSENRERLTSEETLWLHRNYRGEATFLKAWGLHITRNTDRERGLEIMRELMAAESPKGKEQQMTSQLEKQRQHIGKLEITTPRDGKGLQAIEEERNTY
ncbi:hypothetical protein F4805DRAFT_457499 [Annulohypoxylon moriforme]|nr:hypothetical protein F4805DRAFT_457499 [Annulohypoxylon moriforme]